MQIGRPPPVDFDLDRRVADLVAKEERIACQILARRQKRTNWRHIACLLAIIIIYINFTKISDSVQNVYNMIRSSQISWGETSASPKQDLSHLTTQVMQLTEQLHYLQGQWNTINLANETLAAQLLEVTQDTTKKLQELENMIEILGKTKASPKPRKILTEVEGPRTYHEPTTASKAKNAYVLDANGMMTSTDKL